jgi:murein L,D-transpeptidase YcbB/YkuD
MLTASGQGQAADIKSMAFQAYLNTMPVQNRAAKSIRQALVAFYAARGFRPVWLDGNGLNDRARQLLRFLSQADRDGLDPRHYEPEQLPDFIADIADLEGDETALRDLEIELTKKAVNFARDVAGARVNIAYLGENITVKPPVPAPAAILAGLSDAARADDYLAGFAPRHEGYKRLKKALIEARKKKVRRNFTQISPLARIIRPGDSDKRIAQLRMRLAETGDLKAGSDGFVLNPDNDGGLQIVMKLDYFDPQLVAAVKKFQHRNGLHVDGVIGGQTMAALNRKPVNHVRRILVNMERYRWLPRDLGWRHVMVSQTEYRMRMFEHGKMVHTARVIIGKPKHQTPVFSNEIKTVVFNPYWNVPRSIATKEMLPLLNQDPDYLNRAGFEIYDRRGRRTTSIHSRGFFGSYAPVSEETFDFTIRQPPGPNNALGVVKFLFPNKHHVYMHDTPAKSLFSNNTRAFSHGCVRVQNAVDLAEVLLKRDAGWSKQQVADAIASKRNQHITLKTKVPVHLTYFTAWVDDDGRLITTPDIYKRDDTLAAAMGPLRLAMK